MNSLENVAVHKISDFVNFDLSVIPETLLRAEFQRRHHRGRPHIKRPCPDCEQELSAREFRYHHCPQRQSRLEQALKSRVVVRRVESNLEWAYGLARRAKRKLPPSIDIEDLRQVASMYLLRAAEQYNPVPSAGYKHPVPFRVYAWRLIYFGCLMSVRGKHYREAMHEPLPKVLSVASTDTVERASVLRLLSDAIAALPAVQAAVVSLYYFRGMTFVEVGAELRIGPSWVSQMHMAGLAAMREWLAEKGVKEMGDCL